MIEKGGEGAHWHFVTPNFVQAAFLPKNRDRILHTASKLSRLHGPRRKFKIGGHLPPFDLHEFGKYEKILFSL